MNTGNVMNHRYTGLLVLILTWILLMAAFNFSSLDVPSASAQSGSRAERNWEWINHDIWASNHNPQTQINADNVKFTELDWMYAFPPAAQFGVDQPGAASGEGSIAPPLIVDGIVYSISNMRTITALDAITGAVIWQTPYIVDVEAAKERLPIQSAGGHTHGIHYIDGLLIMTGYECSQRAYDAKSGELAWEIKDTCADVVDNVYKNPGYEGPGIYTQGAHPGSFWSEENIFVMTMSGPDLNGGGGRTYVDGYDVTQNPPTRLWRTYLQPGASGDANWAIDHCNNVRVDGWFFSYKAWQDEGKMAINCSEALETCRECLANDWGVPKHHVSAVANIWGQMSFDKETGIIYMGTGNQGGWANNSMTPGPNLFAASVLAMDMKTGEIVWFYQTAPHDMFENDNSWNMALAEIEIDGINRKVLIDQSTSGILYILDAATGEPLRIFDPWQATRSHFAKSFDVRNLDEMRLPWYNYPEPNPRVLIAPLRAGEGDTAYNNGVAFFASGTASAYFGSGNLGGIGQPGFLEAIPELSIPGYAHNVTVIAYDLVNDQVKWRYFIDGTSVRGGVIVTGGVVYYGSAQGVLHMIDEETGERIATKTYGLALLSQQTIGFDSNGIAKTFVTLGGSSGLGPFLANAGQQGVPGAIMTYKLGDNLPDEIIVEVEKVVEVEKEVEVRVEVIKEVEVVTTEEVISPISYVIIGLGVVLAVVSGVLYTRAKK